MKIHSIAVFCGSKAGINPLFKKHTEELGFLLASQQIKIIYGGGSKGLMGVIANAALEKKGKVMGIIPKLLMDWEQQHDSLNELHIVDTMHTRKTMIYEQCDAAIILPGGFGTLDEVFEMLTWNQLNIHLKKIFFLNSGGFYNHLLAHIGMMEEENFLYGKIEDHITVITEPSELKPFLV